MPYKRKVRVIFVGSGDVCRAQMALAIAERLGDALLEARAFTLHAEAITSAAQNNLNALNVAPAPNPTQFDDTQLAWADFIVTLDRSADVACSPLPSTTQKRCYPFAPPQDETSFKSVYAGLEARISGMLGGIRMIV